ncbi:MAG: penicillin-binding protein, partial [Zoogloeaceae bacterium]|nr:penicillin-binding protein [Zoogloeaceae bacterium]
EAYAVFANAGYRIKPFLVKELRDVGDKTLASTNPSEAGKDAPRAIAARNAWIMDSMLRNVVQNGTASNARALKRKDIAGKPGTTEGRTDAWFCGYTPGIVAVTWIGFPTPRDMGSGETGGTAALPMWMDYMRVALANVPETFLPRPEDVTEADAKSARAPSYEEMISLGNLGY